MWRKSMFLFLQDRVHPTACYDSNGTRRGIHPMKPEIRFNRTGSRQRAGIALAALVAWGLLASAGIPVYSAGDLPQLDLETDQSQFLKPLVDTAPPDAVNPNPAGSLQEPLQGKAERTGTIPVNDNAAPAKTLVLTGKVQTLQEAIQSEKDTVDWYAWYLAARDYLGSFGGLRCPLGTPIKFYKNGRIEAMSFDPYCIASVSGKYFLLPQNTKLDALILPVRPGQGPPASPEEINARVRSRYK
jgi:hypothetical protein